MITTPIYKITKPRELLQIYPKCKKLQALEPVIDCFEIYENHPYCYKHYNADTFPVKYFLLKFCPTCHKDVTRIKEVLKLTDKHFNFTYLTYSNLFGPDSDARREGFDIKKTFVEYEMFNDIKHYHSTMKFSVKDKKLGQKIEFLITLSIPIKYYFENKQQIAEMLTKYGEEVINDKVKIFRKNLKTIISKIH
jgi:hypothetical protein